MKNHPRGQSRNRKILIKRIREKNLQPNPLEEREEGQKQTKTMIIALSHEEETEHSRTKVPKHHGIVVLVVQAVHEPQREKLNNHSRMNLDVKNEGIS